MATRCKIVKREQKPHVTQFPPQNACVISLEKKKACAGTDNHSFTSASKTLNS